MVNNLTEKVNFRKIPDKINEWVFLKKKKKKFYTEECNLKKLFPLLAGIYRKLFK